MAASFGASAELAAFMMAYRFAYLLRRLLGEGALHAAFVPRFEALRKEDAQSGLRFFREVYSSAALVAIGICVLAALTLWGLYPWLGAGNQEIAWLTLLMLPCTVFLCLFAIQNSFLQCEQRYFTPAVAPALFNLTWIATVLGLFGRDAAGAMPLLAGGIVLASVVQWLLPSAAVWRRTKGLGWKGARPFSAPVLMMAGGLFYGILGIGASQINGALDYIFARAAHPAGPAYLWYAFRIVQAPVGLFGVAVSGALLPPLVRALKAGDLERYRHFLNFAYRRALWLIVPSLAALFVVGAHVVAILYGRGQFDASDYTQTTGALYAYAPSLLGTALVMVFAPAHYAHGDYRRPALISVVAVALNIGLNALFVHGWGMGPSSVAAATSLSALFNGFSLMSGVRQKGQIRYLMRCLAASFVAALATHLALSASYPLMELGLMGRTAQLLGAGTLFWLVYAGLQLAPRALRRPSVLAK